MDTPFLYLNRDERVTLVKHHRNDYYVIGIQVLIDDGDYRDHSHFIVVDTRKRSV